MPEPNDLPVTLTYEKADAPPELPGKAELVRIRVRHDATEDDVRRALHQYPEAIESTLQTCREMFAWRLMRCRVEP